MPVDIGVLKRLDKPRLSEQLVKSTGATNFTWEAFEGDIHLDRLHSLVSLEGTTKLAQGIFKIVLTPKGSNAQDPDYGTSLSASVGGKMDSERFAEIQAEIVDALIHYNLINNDNPNSDEVIQTIETVRVVQDLDDPRAVRIQIAVTTESGKTVSVQVPQVV